MEKNRYILNDLKNRLSERLAKIVSVYESIEDECQYDAFNEMCGTHLEFCQHWANKLKPRFRWLQPKKRAIWEEYMYYAQHTISTLQGLIDAYQSAIQEAMEHAELEKSIRQKMEIEFAISQELQDAQYEHLRKKDHKPIIGFQVATQKKRKTNKRKKNEQ